eukprot:scaffold3572_cov125-Isochrysis_galbana.AAC.10
MSASGGLKPSAVAGGPSLHWDEALGQTQQCGEKDGSNLADVGRDEVADEGLHVHVDGTALFDRGNNGGKIVVGEDHVGRFLGDLGARDAHSNPDGRLLQCGGIVHAIAGHSRNLASLPQDFDELLLVSRLCAREHHGVAVFGEQLPARCLREVEEFAAHKGAVLQRLARLEDANLLGNGFSRRLRVARDHHDADTRLFACGDGRWHLGPSRVFDTYDAHEGHVLLEVCKVRQVGQLLMARMIGAVVISESAHVLHNGHSEASQRARGHLRRFAQDSLHLGGRQRSGRAVGETDFGAAWQDALGGTLAVEHIAPAG